MIAQYLSGVGLGLYVLLRCRELLPRRSELRFSGRILRELLDLSLLTCAQQSAMNFGILLVQRLVDSFGPVTMAAFAAAVKIDAFAYLPVQDFGNAFSTFVAQNYGAGQVERLREGVRKATAVSAAFSCLISAAVVVLPGPSCASLCRREIPRCWLQEYSTCGWRAPSMWALGASFCSTASTGRSNGRGCRWFSR